MWCKQMHLKPVANLSPMMKCCKARFAQDGGAGKSWGYSLKVFKAISRSTCCCSGACTESMELRCPCLEPCEKFIHMH